ncbi:hypothetical protein AQUCO_07600077v1 [Aquilegia coerulea]|uniref:YGGT family protein n=1 Tax=Aquilegia coerulea TaxID=218851 RepID=A0A2G5C8Q2_AQUCA|nr:hypothetical protein AQUCO_07600077v1 [Aquilegia coerulea]
MATTTITSPSSENTSKNPIDFFSNCLILSSAFLRTPPTHPFLRHSKPNNNNNNNNTNCIQHLHNSLTSTLDRCFKTLNSVAENTPFFQNFISFSDNFRNVFQIRCRKYSSPTSLSMHNFAAILPGDSVAGLVAANGVLNFLNIFNTVLVVRLVLTWFPNAPPAIVSPLSTICDPYLNIFRGIIPPLGGTLDLSPILAFLVLNALTSTASALPAELPIEGQSQDHSSSHPKLLNLTIAQKKWMTRICGDRSKNSSSLN